MPNLPALGKFADRPRGARNRVFRIRIDSSEALLLDRLAVHYHTTRSAVLRALIRREAAMLRKSKTRKRR